MLWVWGRYKIFLLFQCGDWYRHTDYSIWRLQTSDSGASSWSPHCKGALCSCGNLYIARLFALKEQSTVYKQRGTAEYRKHHADYKGNRDLGFRRNNNPLMIIVKWFFFFYFYIGSSIHLWNRWIMCVRGSTCRCQLCVSNRMRNMFLWYYGAILSICYHTFYILIFILNYLGFLCSFLFKVVNLKIC